MLRCGPIPALLPFLPGARPIGGKVPTAPVEAVRSQPRGATEGQIAPRAEHAAVADSLSVGELAIGVVTLTAAHHCQGRVAFEGTLRMCALYTAFRSDSFPRF